MFFSQLFNFPKIIKYYLIFNLIVGENNSMNLKQNIQNPRKFIY